jgi:hypothetical protein
MTKTRKTKTPTKADILADLKDIQSLLNAGYPFYGVPRVIRRAIRYIKNSK